MSSGLIEGMKEMRHFRWIELAVVTIWLVGCGTTTNTTDCRCSDSAPVLTAAQNKTEDTTKPTSAPHVPANLVFDPEKPIVLPPPQIKGGMPLMEAIAGRHSVRSYSEAMLSLDQLSTLFFAAHGISRPDSKKRTTPTAMNWQNMEVYVATKVGLFVYDAAQHSLVPVLSDDIRALTGKQPFVAKAPVNLIYVSDDSRLDVAEEPQKARYSAAHAGFISQNVYLYCTSAGLATVVRAYYDEEALHDAMKLPESKRIVLAQTVGLPAHELEAE